MGNRVEQGETGLGDLERDEEGMGILYPPLSYMPAAMPCVPATPPHPAPASPCAVVSHEQMHMVLSHI